MKQVLVKKGSVFLENVPAPLIEPGHILVEVHYSLISTGTELSGVANSGKSLVQKVLEQPEKVLKVVDFLKAQGVQKTVLKIKDNVERSNPTGYSCSGIVVQVGKGVTNFQPGDRVACAGAGIANHAEIVMVPSNLAVKVPEKCELKDAASVTLGAIAMQGVRRADPRLGEIVAVIGLGLLGQLTVQMLKAAGCQVIGLDIDDRRVEIAKKSGADLAINTATKNVDSEIRRLTINQGVDSAIITAGSNSDAIVQQAMEITRKKGRVVVVGAVGLGLNRSPFYEKEIDFLISCSYGPGRYDEKYEKKGVDYPYAYVRWTENRNMQEYLRLIAAEKLDLLSILEQEYPLSEVQQAYEDLQTSSDKPLGVLLHYPIDDENKLAEKLTTKIRLTTGSHEGKIRIAIIGAGAFAKSMHLPNLKKLSDLYHVRAIVSGTGSNAVETAKQFGADYASSNYDDVLNDPDVDAVLICTRHDLHANMAIQAAEAGKAILVEKPMALNEEELDKLTNVLDKTGVPFMVGFNRRFSPAARRIKEIVKDRTNPMMLYYRMNAGYIPTDHWVHHEEGGGRIIGEACHIIDLFRYIIGAPVIEVSSSRINPRTEHVLGEDNVFVTFKYEDGSVATLLYTALGNNGISKEYMELYVDNKALIMDDYLSLSVVGSSERGWKSSIQDKGHMEELKSFADKLKTSTNENKMTITINELVETSLISLKIVN